MTARKEMGIAALLVSLGFVALGCSNESPAEVDLANDAGGSEPYEDAGEVITDAPSEAAAPTPFVEVSPTNPDDIGPCDEAPAEVGTGNDFCPAASCGECDFERPPLDLIAKASDWGQGVRFVAMRDDLVLAEAGDGKPLLYRIETRSEQGQPRAQLAAVPFDTAPASEMRGRAIAGGSEKYAVLCGDTSCMVYRLHEKGGSFVAKPLPVTMPMKASDVVGAFVRWGEDEIPICLYGDGIHCLKSDGSFDALASGEGGKLLAVDGRGEWLVGENGRVVRLKKKKALEPYTGIGARLHTVGSSYDGSYAWAAGDEGTVVALGKDGPRVCRSTNLDIVASSSQWLGWMERSGAWLHRYAERWCSWTPAMENVVAIDLRRCGIVLNRWLMSADEIRAERLCMYD